MLTPCEAVQAALWLAYNEEPYALTDALWPGANEPYQAQKIRAFAHGLPQAWVAMDDERRKLFMEMAEAKYGAELRARREARPAVLARQGERADA